MGYVHLLITVLALLIFFIIGLAAGLLILIVNLFNKKAADAMSCAYVRFGMRFIGLATGSRVTVIGRENIPVGRAALYTANHRSLLDPIFAGPYIPGLFTAVAKQELNKVPFLHFWMSRIHCLFLDRSDIKKGAQMVNDAVDFLKSGTSVFICPEGTRNHVEGTLLDFHGGSFKIAIRSNAPVVPVTILHTGLILEDHFPKILPQHVTVVFDKPIETEGMSIADRKALPERVKTIIADTYKQYDNQ